jgi:chromosome segregation ATPase
MDDTGLAPKHPQQLIFENVSPATRLLEKRRQMYEVQDALETQKHRFAKDELAFRKKEEQLRQKDLMLQHQLFRFNKFLQDNEGKRRRAESRALEEHEQIKEKEKEIAILEKQLEDSERLRKELQEEVEKNSKYEDFLRECQEEQSEEYQEIQDLVTRYETLDSANKDLMESQRSTETRIEEFRTEFQNYKREQAVAMLDLTNKEDKLSSELDEVSRERQVLEHRLDEVTQADSQHSLHFGQILMTVENLFERCTTKRKNLQHVQVPLDDEDEDGKLEQEENKQKQQEAIRQLKTIYAYLKDFKDIVEELRKRTKADTARNRGPLQVGSEPTKPPEPRFEMAEVRGDHGSHNSGSQGNTRELSRNVRAEQAPGSAALAAGESASKDQF